MRYALEAMNVQLVADLPAKWRFPVGYLCERLLRYLPVPPLSTILRGAARLETLSECEVTLDLRDSRIFMAKAS